MQRRGFIGGIVATGAVLASSTSARAGQRGVNATPAAIGDAPPEELADSHEPQLAADAPAPWALLSPMSNGSDVGLGWRISDLSEVRRGAAVLSLKHEDGSEARVHLCRIAGKPRGVAHSDHVDLMLMNKGDGRQNTHEGIGRVLISLAKVIQHNERHAAAGSEGLLPHTVRVACFRSQRCLD